MLYYYTHRLILIRSTLSIMSTPSKAWGNKCLNPLNKKKHGKGKGLRIISESLRSKISIPVPLDGKLCWACRTELQKFENPSSFLQENTEMVISENDDHADDVPEIDDPVDNVSDEYDVNLAFTPSSENTSRCNDDYHKAGVEVLEQIKAKFRNSTSNSEKFMLLTLAPQSWGRKKIAAEFNASERQVRKAKEMVAEHGILTLPNSKKARNKLTSETESLVKAFYANDENSRLLPGMKDFVSVKKDDGSREQVQKRLILCNLSELYEKFIQKHSDVTIGFSKFAELRPRHCVLAGSSGTHTVCVCTHHENVKLMLDAIHLQAITKDTSLFLKSYHDCLQEITCRNPTSSCHLGKCELCPDGESLKNHLREVLREHYVERIEFQVWQHTDRSTLKTEIAEIDEFIEELCRLLFKLKPHDFISKLQSSYVNELKKNLPDNQFLVQCDFAENYAFVVQNAAQSFHWNNNQCTIFTAVIYYKEQEELKHRSIAILSDSLKHDTIAVYECQKIIIKYLKEHFNPTKLIYFTDGAAQHFKNKYNLKNLQFHKQDFGILAEWHFHATAHGKGPCDGIGGNLKRLAARASLQLSAENHILTPHDLYRWAKENMNKTIIFFSAKSDQEDTAELLKGRFTAAVTVSGTQKYHAVIPTDDDRLILKYYSSAADYEIYPKIKTNKRKTSMQKTGKCKAKQN